MGIDRSILMLHYIFKYCKRTKHAIEQKKITSLKESDLQKRKKQYQQKQKTFSCNLLNKYKSFADVSHENKNVYYY